jgi:hypothetical protein
MLRIFTPLNSALAYAEKRMIDTPENILKIFKEKSEGISIRDLFNKPKYSWLFDIWIAGRFGDLFGKYIQTCEVEVDDQDQQSYYDFKLHVENIVIPFQATELLETERRRGAEFKRRETIFDQPFWKESSTEPYEYLDSTIKNKLDTYRSGATDINLVVYANLFGFEEEYKVVYDYCKESTEQFNSVWLFSSHVFGALFEKDGKYYKNDCWIKL